MGYVEVNIIKRENGSFTGLTKKETIKGATLEYLKENDLIKIYAGAGSRPREVGNVWKVTPIFKSCKLGYEVYNVYVY